MATTAVIPTPVVSGTATPERVTAPAVSGTAVVEHLPLPVVSGTATPTGIKVPAPAFNQFRTKFFTPAPLVSLAATYVGGSGGMLFGGAAVIVGDPFAGSGGIKFGGAAIASFPTIVIFAMEGDGGLEFGGEAVVQEHITFTATGGMGFGGSAIVQERITFTAAGGFLLGGAAPQSAIFAVTASGGALFGGAAVVSATYREVGSGGMAFGGSAIVSSYSAYHLPTGGIKFGGSGNGFVLPVGYAVTAENPYNEDFPGWAMNFKTGAASRYERLPTNSICRFMGKTYVSNAAGIYELGAADDAGQPIRASIDLPLSDYGTERSKRVPDVYVGVKTTGRMKLVVGTNFKARKYYWVPRIEDRTTTARVQVGQGIEGRYWTMGLANIEGADFEFESLVLKPRLLSRPGK